MRVATRNIRLLSRLSPRQAIVVAAAVVGLGVSSVILMVVNLSADLAAGLTPLRWVVTGIVITVLLAIVGVGLYDTRRTVDN